MRVGTKWLAAVVLLAVLARVFVLLACPFPATPDVFERVRVSEHVLQNGEFFSLDKSIALYERNYSYPPFSDLLLAFLGWLSALGLLAVSFALAFVLGVLSSIALFLLSKKWLSNRNAFFAVLLFNFFPLISLRFHTFVAESLGIFLLLLFLYLLEIKNKPVFAGIVLGLLGLTHYRSVFTLAAVIVFVLVFDFAWAGRERLKNYGKAFAVGLIIFLPWLCLRFSEILSIKQYHNLFTTPLLGAVLGTLFSPISLLVLAVFLALFVLGFFWSAFRGRKGLVPWYALVCGVLVYMVLGFFGDILPFYSKLVFVDREIAFLVVPAAFFSGYALQKIEKLWIFILMLLLFSAYFLFFTPSYCYPISNSALAAAQYAGENHAGQTVLANSENGFLLARYGNRVVLGAFMEDVPDASERFGEMHSMLVQGENAAPLFDKYNASCILVSPKEKLPKDVEAVASLEFEENGYRLYCVD